jgi:hypothetical protein
LTAEHATWSGLESLYLQHAPSALRFAYFLCGDQETARDLVQVAFVRAPSCDGYSADVPVEAGARFTASALLGLLTWWLEGDDERFDAEVIDRTFVSLANDGIRETFGVSV